MYQLQRVAGITLVAVIVAVAVVAHAMAAPNPISIQQCFVTVPKPLSKKAGGTQIKYVNQGSKSATHVTFAVGYRNAENNYLRKVTDDGEFEPGHVIDHHFNLYQDVTYAGKKVQSCSPVSVTWADGSKWTK